ncbi:MAG TPA: beta-ketoacyl-[acyl-carrier-protein] synthase family protein [Stenotrophobium sp.]|jgi:3-oxoacyl-[acyl-carrier-protein] synthase-1|nr:beta-ketoacyl-[acyl-carrier-protein] synthase family protein [Stenotrophobium sp.]
MQPLAITHYTVTSALGAGREAQLNALQSDATGLRHRNFESCTIACWIGEVRGLDAALPDEWQDWECRNNRLAWLALQQDGFLDAARALRMRHGAGRVGVFIGTSTAGVHATELAYRERQASQGPLPEWFNYRGSQNCFSAADFVREALQLQGPAMAIATACSSSAKVFASAHRAMQAGLCDAAIVGGVDSLCLTTLYGFNALQLVSPEICRPADVARRGISIGEAAGFAILEQDRRSGLGLLGYGESSDAYHMSTPHPQGEGAATAMRAALARAGIQASEVDYINLHGTATPANDAAEDQGVVAVFGERVPCSSTKGWTGHALGAAAIAEAVIALQCIEHGLLPGSLNTQEKDPALRGNIVLKTQPAKIDRVLSNSFGFGGNNCSLLLGRLS